MIIGCTIKKSPCCSLVPRFKLEFFDDADKSSAFQFLNDLYAKYSIENTSQDDSIASGQLLKTKSLPKANMLDKIFSNLNSLSNSNADTNKDLNEVTSYLNEIRVQHND